MSNQPQSEQVGSPDLSDQINALQQSLRDTADRLDALQQALDNHADDQSDDGPLPSKTDPLSDSYQPGDTVTVMVEDDGSNTKHGDPMGRVDGAVVFLKGNYDFEFGDTANATISTVEDNYMRGVVTELNPVDSA